MAILRKVPMPPGAPLMVAYSSARMGPQVLHYHNNYLEIQIACSSPFLYQIGDKEVLVDKYTALIIRPPHCHILLGTVREKDAVDKFCVLLNLGRCRRMMHGLSGDMRRFIFRKDQEAFCKIPLGGSFYEIKTLLQTMIAEFKYRPLGWQECARAFGESLIVLIYRASCERHGEKQKGGDQNLRERIADSILRTHGRDQNSLAAIAKRLGYSYSYTSFLCHKIFGMSLRETRIACKIETAKQLLERTDNQKTGVVAEQAGFTDLPNFYHAFRKHTGSTPSEYRKFYQSH